MRLCMRVWDYGTIVGILGLRVYGITGIRDYGTTMGRWAYRGAMCLRLSRIFSCQPVAIGAQGDPRSCFFQGSWSVGRFAQPLASSSTRRIRCVLFGVAPEEWVPCLAPDRIPPASDFA